MSKNRGLSELERETLEEGFRNHPKLHFRNRVHCILLRADGFSVKEVGRIFKTRKHTVYEWLRRYQASGFLGLLIRPGRGTKAAMNGLSTDQIALIESEIKRNPQSLRSVCVILSEQFGFKITKPMLQKYLKKTKIHLA